MTYPLTHTEKFILYLNDTHQPTCTAPTTISTSTINLLPVRASSTSTGTRPERPRMTTLLAQTHEVLHEILSYLYPQDLASLSRTCSSFSLYIKDNRLLWRAVYLHNFDAPKNHLEGGEPQWEQDAKDFVTLMKICQSPASHKITRLDPANLELGAKAIIKLATNARIVREEAEEEEESRNLRLIQYYLGTPENVETFVHSSNLYHAAQNQPESKSKELSQLLAKVHCYAGISADQFVHDKSERVTRMIRSNMAPDTYARSRIYDLRYHNDKNKWGPWSDDGNMDVDWEKVECIMIDLAYNVGLFTKKVCSVLKELWQSPFVGVQQGSYEDSYPISNLKDQEGADSSKSPQSRGARSSDSDSIAECPSLSLAAQDPYGVTGTWQRIVCFLDYSDFHYLNFSSNPPLSQRRPPIDHEEAIRLILMELQVTKIGWDPNSSSKLTGTVELTAEKEVRWSTLSYFQGESRWRSECVQIGGVRSKRGVCGTWFEK